MAKWIELLRAECKRSSQARVAARIGISATVINQVLKGKYPGNLSRMRQRIEFAVSPGTVSCPVLGEISRDDCLAHQRQPFAATNAQRVRLFLACRNGCPNSRIGE